MTKIMKQKARIGMALALPEYFITEKPKPGRLRNLLGRLERECAKRMGYMIGRGILLQSEENELSTKMQEFGKKVGWNKEKHLATYVVFLLAMFDAHPEPGIIAALNEISSFLDDGDNSPRACMPAGLLAFEKWEGVMGDVQD